MRVTATLNESQSKYIKGLADLHSISLSQAVQMVLEENIQVQIAKLKHREAVLHGIALVREYGTGSGRPIGRPMRDVPIEVVRKLRAVGLSWREISSKLDIPRRTLQRRAEEEN